MRKDRGISQRDLGKAIHLSQREVSFIETGRRPLSLKKITAYLTYINNQSCTQITDTEWVLFTSLFVNSTIGKIVSDVFWQR